MEADILHARKTPLLFLGGVARIALCAAGPGRSTALRHSNQSNQATKENSPPVFRRGGPHSLVHSRAGEVHSIETQQPI